MINEWIGYLSVTHGCRILEFGSESVIEHFSDSDSLNVTIDSLTDKKQLEIKEPYDFIVVPELMNQLTKKEALSLLDRLLKVTKDSVFLLLDEFGRKEPLFIPDFCDYDISYYYIEEIQRSLIKIHKQEKQEEVKECVLNKDITYRSLNILYVLPHKNLTGGLKMLYEQMKSLQKKGHRIKVIIRGDFDCVVPDWVEDFIPDEEIIIKSYDKYTNYFNEVDLVFAGFYNQIHELENHKVPVLYWEQGHEALYGDVKDKGLESSIRNSLTKEFKRDIYLATDSNYVHDIVKTRFNRDSYVLPIFIDTDFYYPLKHKEKSELLTILLVGNPFLSFKGFQKALTVLLNAWNQGYQFKVEWACQVKPTLNPLPFEITYHENVSQPELAAVYRNADILLTCSLYEGCPMPPLEAMASGVAVVTTNCGGVNQYATHGENALIAFSNTIGELTDLLKVALSDESKRKSLIEKGLETAISLNYENGSVLLEKILLSVVADHQMKPVDSRKKVLFMIGTLLGGGAEKVLCNIVKHLDKDLFDVTVQTVFDQGVYIDEVKKYAKYKTIYKSIAPINEVEQLKEYYRYLENLSDEAFSREVINEDYDIEIAFLEDQSTKIIANSPNKNSRKIAWVHANLITEPGSAQFYKSFEHQKNCYEKFDEIVFVSKGVQDAFIEKFRVRSKFKILYNPIDEKSIIKKAQEQLNEDLRGPKFKIISVGRLIPIKGFERLLVAHRQLIKEGFDYELWILGDGPQKGALEQFVRENEMEVYTKFLGFKENPYPYINDANLMVSSSHTEGFSTVLTEALILGTPVLTTDCSGTAELLGDNEYGIIVENDLQKLYEGLRRILTNTIEYHKYCQRSAIRGRRFNIDETISALEEFLIGNEEKE